MIDPALNVAQRNLSFELQRRGARRLRECSVGCKRHRRHCHEAYRARVTHHHWLSLLSIGFQLFSSAGYRLAGDEVVEWRLDCLVLDHHRFENGPLRIFSLTDKMARCAEAFWMIVGMLALVIDSSAALIERCASGRQTPPSSGSRSPSLRRLCTC